MSQIDDNIARLDAVIDSHRQANKTLDDSLIAFLRDQLVSSWQFIEKLCNPPKAE